MIEGAGGQWDAVDRATAHVQILGADMPNRPHSGVRNNPARFDTELPGLAAVTVAALRARHWSAPMLPATLATLATVMLFERRAPHVSAALFARGYVLAGLALLAAVVPLVLTASTASS